MTDAQQQLDSITHPVPAGARCEVHPSEAAVIVCSRCGGFACRRCCTELETKRYCVPCADMISPLADPARRLAAYLLDAALWSLPLLLSVNALLVGSSATSLGVAALGAALTLAVTVINLRWVRDRGQSIGKRVLRLRVVCLDGSRMSLGRVVFMRNVLPAALSLIPIVGAIFGAVDMLFIFRHDRRTVHDLIAGSIVVAVNAGRSTR